MNNLRIKEDDTLSTILVDICVQRMDYVYTKQSLANFRQTISMCIKFLKVNGAGIFVALRS